MRLYLLLLSILFAVKSQSQVKEEYYDFFWKPCDPVNARFFSIIQKTDSGWLRSDYFAYEKKLQMQALYKDEACKINDGKMLYYHSNGNLSLEGFMKNSQKQGVCVSYHYNGLMSDSATYVNNIPVGSRIMWYSNGYISDSIYHLNDSVDVHMEWFDDGSPAAGGFKKNGKSHGKWNYYHQDGKLSGNVVYYEGKIVTAKYYNEDGTEHTDTLKANTEATFKKGGDKGWLNYLYKNLRWPSNLKFSESSTLTVGVSFTVDENGKIIDAYSHLPLHPEFDKIALEIVKKSPDWQPAVQHNRKIKAYRRQPISFSQSD